MHGDTIIVTSSIWQCKNIPREEFLIVMSSLQSETPYRKLLKILSVQAKKKVWRKYESLATLRFGQLSCNILREPFWNLPR